MIKPWAAVLATIPFLFGTPAHAVDGQGLTDGSIYDHTGVSPYEPRKRVRRANPPPEGDYKYIPRCYWTVKTTDGWWPTGATQVCVRQRVE